MRVTFARKCSPRPLRRKSLSRICFPSTNRRRWIVVADFRKNSQTLGTTVRPCLIRLSTLPIPNRQYTAGVPIEVAPFAYAKLLQNLHRLGSPQATLRMAKTAKAGPVVSDNGNFVIDAPFEEWWLKNPHEVTCFSSVFCAVVFRLM